MQKVEKQQHLLGTEMGHKALSAQERDKSSDIRRSQSPMSSQMRLRRTTTGEVGTESQDCIWIARKVLSKRNLGQLLLEIAELCTGTARVGSERGLALGFLLVKKSTIIASQLAKFLETGRGEGLRMDDKLKEKLTRHRLFAGLEKVISKSKFI